MKAVLFDFDGTLVRTQAIKIQSLQTILKNLWGAEPIQLKKIFLSMSGNSRRELLDAISFEFRGKPLEEKEYAEISVAFSAKNLDVFLKATPGELLQAHVMETLQRLKEQQVLCFISSAAVREEIVQVADHTGLTEYFQEILGSDRSFKKGSAHVAYLCEKYKLHPSEMMFVGDEVADIRLNLPTGVKTFGVVWDRPHYRELLMAENPHGVFSEIQELLQFTGTP